MKIVINDMANLPLQRQIFEQIRAKILSGELAESAELPSIRAFARDNQVSVITVQKAYQMLESEGLIYSRRAKGFFVASLKDSQKSELSIQSFENAFRPIIEKARKEGLTNSVISQVVNRIINEEEK